ncbi:MAG: tRNA 5-methoxyuridine(34)/uridine 5-oxyacetic acid(34) synthase CmoB [Desulfobacteraceae bacterium]|nr:tRNA 5-methoxyuridine(34)/uridine 5-oxyacetic acid(34) synthase CmoB [Desulfobacteraceae bacterium]
MEKILLNHEKLKIDQWFKELENIIKNERIFFDNPKGNACGFTEALNSLPQIKPSSIDLNGKKIKIGVESDSNRENLSKMKQALKILSPWRKGPFDLFGIDIDTEWQSWMKWDRIKDHLGDIKGKKILDIGSSNGYYMFKLAAQNPLMVVGVEPQHSFYFQYLAMQKYLNLENVYCLPVKFETLPVMNNYFDTIFCMGILYHRKSPVEMLQDMRKLMAKQGTLVVENLVLESNEGLCLFPESRYAKMRNVFFIPDLKCMQSWLKRAGFSNIQCVDVSKTTVEEQRQTDWIQTESLIDFFDPKDHNKTFEGYPAPVRAIFTASA